MISPSRLSGLRIVAIAASPLILSVITTSRSHALGEPPAVTPQQEAAFEAKIRPLLAANCYPCHGSTQQAGGLRLDSLAAMQKGGATGSALTPGDPDKSAIIRAVRYDGKVKMPPTGKLRPEEIQALTAWVKAGAPWPEPKHTGGVIISATGITPEQRQFWSFQPVHKPALPAVEHASWVKSPIDRFILAKLEEKGLKPAPPDDRRSLIRRAYFDLTGLPPTPEQIEAFVNDKSPDAFARVVDQLLASPHYGERWGRHWLDVARYADSNGLDENLAFGNAWRYRDYVVDSFNRDKPYDVFVREQLAGDLMPAPDEKLRNERLTATAFLSMGPKVLAEPDKPKLEMDIIDEQIEVTSKAFLGLTVACARCHNHKFDPIPTKDYYALAGIFKSTRTMENLGGVARVMERPLMTAELEAQIKAYEQRLAAAQDTEKKVRDPANAAVLADLKANGEKYLQAGWELARQPELKSVAERPIKPGERRMVIEAENFNRGNVIRDFTTYGKGIGVIINQTPPDFAEWDVTVPAAGAYQVEFRYASAEERPVRLLLNGKVVNGSTAGQNTGSFQPDGQRWEVQGAYMFHAGLNTLRMECDNVIPHFDKLLVEPLADAAGTPGQPAPKTAEEIAADSGVHADMVRYFAEQLRSVKDMASARKLLTAAKNGLLALPDKPERFYPDDARAAVMKAQHDLEMVKASEPRKPMALAVEDGKIENVRVHIRGSTDNLGDLVPRHFLTVMGGDTVKLDDKHSGRLELANWITRPTNPLVARVEVNRIWEGHFGQGLVRTADNWGLLGDRPELPELLDWLAATFVEDGWSIKKMQRRIMLSSAYQMSCATDPRAMEVDPDNRLCWRMNRQRLDAEPFRDAILAVSGKLDVAMGGSLLTTGDNDYVTNDQSANQAQYGSPRRSIYLPVIRNALFDMFQAFDFGDPSMTHAFRNATTVAPQALYMMNSPFVLEQARSFAGRVIAHNASSDSNRIAWAYEQALGRAPSSYETVRANNFLIQDEAMLSRTMKDAAACREKAWQNLCQVLFASNEFIYLN